MMWRTELLKTGCLVAAGLCSGVAFGKLAHAPDSPIRVQWLRYVRHLDDDLRTLRLRQNGGSIAKVQFFLLILLVVLETVSPLDLVPLLLSIAVIALGPVVWLKNELKKRIQRIEKDINGFLVGLANSLKASPSLGKAIRRSQTVLSGPLAAEIEVVSRDIRLGASVDQALLSLGARVRSPSLDAAMTGILIGRQVGGNLPEILETTASTLREMERLDGVIRSKTAEGKAQVIVIALAPPVVYVAFDFMQTGYFLPFTTTFVGSALLAFACLLWLGAIFLAKYILAVDI